MKRAMVASVVALLVGCAAQTGPTVDDAIADYISATELEEVDIIRTKRQYETSDVTERYAIVRTRKDVYLVRFDRLCREPDERKIVADIRYDKNALRPRVDTIRGCRISKIFAIDEAGAEELKMLADASVM